MATSDLNYIITTLNKELADTSNAALYVRTRNAINLIVGFRDNGLISDTDLQFVIYVLQDARRYEWNFTQNVRLGKSIAYLQDILDSENEEAPEEEEPLPTPTDPPAESGGGVTA